jgi:hypothetical protein
MLRRLASLSIILALACTPAGDDVADAETQATSDTGDATCYEISDEVSSIDVIDCGLTQPCAAAEFTVDPCEVTADYDPAVGACIVEQLAAGTAALHQVNACPGGQFSESWRLQVFGDGTVLYVDNQFLDIGGPGYATWRAMPDAAYFQACQTDTPEALIDCLDGIRQQECQLGEPSCP